MLMPAARDSRMRATEMRVPRTRGLPPRCSASATIQVSIRFKLTSGHYTTSTGRRGWAFPKISEFPLSSSAAAVLEATREDREWTTENQGAAQHFRKEARDFQMPHGIFGKQPATFKSGAASPGSSLPP